MSQLAHQNKNSGGFENQMIGVVMGLNPRHRKNTDQRTYLNYYDNHELIIRFT